MEIKEEITLRTQVYIHASYGGLVFLIDPLYKEKLNTY